MGLSRWAAVWLAVMFLSACSDDRVPRPGGTQRTPSCSLPICGACACDLTTACDPDCGDCDPECGSCRQEGATCSTPRDAGPQADAETGGGDGSVQGDASPIDAGPCELAPSQPVSAPCCLSLGIDACGAALFCAAFDGRTQPTCYPEGSRNPGDTCSGERQCSRGAFCDPTGRCVREGALAGGEACTDDRACSTGICDPASRLCAAAEGESCEGQGVPCVPSESLFCDPFEQICLEAREDQCDFRTHNPCSSNEACDVRGPSNPPQFGCRPEGSAGAGAVCARPDDCVRGTTCVQISENDIKCRTLCSADLPCSTGMCFCPPMGDCTRGVGICL